MYQSKVLQQAQWTSPLLFGNIIENLNMVRGRAVRKRQNKSVKYLCACLFRHCACQSGRGVPFTLLSRLVSELTEVLFILIYSSFYASGNDTQCDRGKHIQVNKGRRVFPYKTLSKPIITIPARKVKPDATCCNEAVKVPVLLY